MSGTEQPPADGTEPHLFDLIAIAARRWRWTVGLPAVAVAVALLAALLWPPRYTARTTVIPEARSAQRLPAGLAGLAGQLGLNLDLGQAQSPKLYAEVVKSRGLLAALLRDSMADPGDPGTSRPLLEIIGKGGRSPEDSVGRGVKWLTSRIGAEVQQQTGVLAISVTLRDPALAAAVSGRVVDHLNDFNTRQRQSQARERRRFVEARLTDGRTALREAEGTLRGFYERNRNWQQSFGLTFEEGRLRREVDVRQEVLVTLTREFETARIEEVNDTPVLTVIDRAVPPRERSFPRPALFVGIALVLGVLVGTPGALVAESVERARRGLPGRHEAMVAALRQAKGELRALLPRRQA